MQYFNSLGVKYVWVDAVFPGVGDDVHSFAYLDMDNFVDKFLEATKYADTLGMEYRTFLHVILINVQICIAVHVIQCHILQQTVTCQLAIWHYSENMIII